MPRISRNEPKPDVLEVVHNVIPEDASAAGAPPIPEQSRPLMDDAVATVPDTAPAVATTPAPAATGMTWRRMAGTLALSQAACYLVMIVAASVLYGLEFFAPLAIATVLYAGAALWIRRGTKAGLVATLTIHALALVMFGGLFFGWTGFMYPKSWFEMAFATFTVIVPLAGVVASIAALRHKDGDDAARTPLRATAAVSAAIVLIGIVGSATAGDATRLPGDVTLDAKNFEFAQTSLTAKAGDVAIYFDNGDPFEHNVEVKGHGTSANAPGGHAIRHVFQDLTPGTYAYFCAIHPDMKGTLTVT